MPNVHLDDGIPAVHAAVKRQNLNEGLHLHLDHLHRAPRGILQVPYLLCWYPRLSSIALKADRQSLTFCSHSIVSIFPPPDHQSVHPTCHDKPTPALREPLPSCLPSSPMLIKRPSNEQSPRLPTRFKPLRLPDSMSPSQTEVDGPTPDYRAQPS